MLNIGTLAVVNIVGCAVGVWAMAMLWTSHRDRFAGLGLWLVSMLMQMGGIGLIHLSGRPPAPFSVLLAKILLLAGALLLLFGLARFLGRPVAAKRNLALLLAGVAVLVATGSPALREVVVGGVSVAFLAQAARLLQSANRTRELGAGRATAVILALLALATAARAVAGVLNPLPPGGPPIASPAAALTLLAFDTLGTCLTISLILLVASRLVDDVRAKETLFTKAFHSSPNGILLARAGTGEVFEVNDGFQRQTGYLAEELKGRTIRTLHLCDRQEDLDALSALVRRGDSVRDREVVVRKKDGSTMTGLCSVEALEFGGKPCVLVSIADITEISRMRAELEILAAHDALTGLANRTSFQERFALARAACHRSGACLAILSLDLDKFKDVNDRFGHPGGDAVLVEVARRLGSTLRATDVAARFGGDEFVVLLGQASRQGAADAARRILDAFRAPFDLAGQALELTVSLGIALSPDDGDDLETLLKHSDHALYQVKAHGRDGYAFHAQDEGE